MAFYNLLVDFVGAHQILLVFLGSFFFGDTVILSFALLSGQGVLSVYTLLIFGFLGTVVSDSLWFFLGKYFFMIDYLKKKIKRYKGVVSSVRKITGKRPFLVLLFAKFMYGTRILFIVYLSVRKLSYTTFLMFNMLGTAIWLLTLTAIGWFAARGTVNLIPALRQGEYLLTIFIVLAVIIRLITQWITKRMTKA